jgi:hypothetical protein
MVGCLAHNLIEQLVYCISGTVRYKATKSGHRSPGFNFSVTAYPTDSNSNKIPLRCSREKKEKSFMKPIFPAD